MLLTLHIRNSEDFPSHFQDSLNIFFCVGPAPGRIHFRPVVDVGDVIGFVDVVGVIDIIDVIDVIDVINVVRHQLSSDENQRSIVSTLSLIC